MLRTAGTIASTKWLQRLLLRSSKVRCIAAAERRTLEQHEQPQQQLCAHRYFSSEAPPNTDYQYQYPAAKDPPEISQTTAKEAREREAAATAAEKKKYQLPSIVTKESDPFGDLDETLSEQQREEIRVKQSKELSATKLSPRVLPITREVPSHIPPNVPDEQLDKPQTILTTLDNGIRVVSQETFGQMATLGAVCRLGSRYETVNKNDPNYNMGVTNLLEGLILRSDDDRIENSAWGRNAQLVSNTNREQSLFFIDLLKTNLEPAVEVLAQSIFEPNFDAPKRIETIEDTKRALIYQSLNMQPEFWLMEYFQEAAYGLDQQLGHPHFISIPNLPPNNQQEMMDPVQLEYQALQSLEHLTPQVVQDFWKSRVLEQPNGLVVAAAGVRHEDFVQLVQKHFGGTVVTDPAAAAALTGNQPVDFKPTEYRGGEVVMERETNNGLIRVALAVPVGGWHSSDLVPSCVLHTLLGGGSSFSAGGPGKGMYTRLYRQVLNRYSWAESAEALTCFHDETGLLILCGSTVPEKARDMVQCLAEHIARLAHEYVTDEELNRARNMLKNQVLINLESRFVLFEDLARQVLTYGGREDIAVTCARIDAVTKEDIQALMVRALKQAPPTLAVTGPDLSNCPSQKEVARWFSSSLG